MFNDLNNRVKCLEMHISSLDYTTSSSIHALRMDLRLLAEYLQVEVHETPAARVFQKIKRQETK